MAQEQRNEFLDADDPDDSGSEGYNSEGGLLKGSRNPKRRKLEEDEDISSDGESDVDFDPAVSRSSEPKRKKEKEKLPDAAEAAQEPESPKPTKGDTKTTKDKNKKNKKRESNFEKESSKADAESKKSGVVHLSRIPPFMKPQKLRSLLEPYGEIGRVFLAPEDPQVHARRVKAGGNKKKSFTEGWVEFKRKSDAKKVCDLLNTQPIGGKKGSYYHDDIWSMLYLKGFKWRHLTQQIEAENQEREARLRAEIEKSTRENEEFVRNVEKAKIVKGMETKAAAKRKRKAEAEVEDGGDPSPVLARDTARRRSRQPIKIQEVGKEVGHALDLL